MWRVGTAYPGEVGGRNLNKEDRCLRLTASSPWRGGGGGGEAADEKGHRREEDVGGGGRVMPKGGGARLQLGSGPGKW